MIKAILFGASVGVTFMGLLVWWASDVTPEQKAAWCGGGIGYFSKC